MTWAVAVGLAASGIGAAGARGANIGINFVGGNKNSTDTLTAAMSAGVVPQTNWNNATSAAAGNGIAYADDGVTAHNVNYSWSAKSVYDVSSTTMTLPDSSNGDQILNNGAVYTNGTTTGSAVTVNNLTAVGGSYSVYAYFITDHQANIGVTLTPTGGTATTYYGSTPATPNAAGYIDGTTASGFTYTPATSTTAGTYTANADYALFTVPSTYSGFTLTETLFTGSTAGNGALAAVQIVGVTPEPASLGLLAVGALGLLGRRRRAGA